MKTLIIAEKPSAARDIAYALGKVSKKNDLYASGDYLISSSIGHLVELFMPEDIDKKLKRWKIDTLPIIPDKFQLRPIEKTKKKFLELKKLLQRKDVDTIINACDAGREGELIFTYIYELTECTKPVKRMWMLSMTRDGIRLALENLRSQTAMQPLQAAARCRSESDWLIGINGTRACTARMFANQRGQVATVGRVQTPTLTLVIERQKEIREFEPRTYWRILGRFKVAEGAYEGIYIKPNFKKEKDPHDRADRLWEREQADPIIAAFKPKLKAKVTEEKKITRQSSPRLYDLTTLQREANSRFGLSAKVTLGTAQALYEKYKMITYPRTDSKALPEDYIPVCRKVLEKIESPLLKPHAQEVLQKHGIQPSKRIFNNKQVSDHFAIIPTEITSGKLSELESKIYTMIVQRFIAIFFPVAEYAITTRISAVNDHHFKTEGKILLKPGWKAVYGQSEKNQERDNLPPLSPADGTPPEAETLSLELQEEVTKPPPPYTEATLLAAMEGAGKFVEDEALAEALKKKGLGTPATRAQIIEHLITLRYIERVERELLPTQKAEGLIEFLKVLKIEDLTSPAMTGEWESKLHQIESNTLSREAFMQGIVAMTKDIVERARKFDESRHNTRVTQIISPSDNKPLIETLNTYQSQDKAYTIYKTICQRKMEEAEIRELLANRKIGPLDNFRSKTGDPFSAVLTLNEENKVRFLFEKDPQKNKESTLDLSQFDVVAQCPICKEPIVETPSNYICKNNDGPAKSCSFRVSRTILGKTIPRDQFIKLIQDRKTDLLTNFRSNRTKRLFSAHLILKNGGKIGFEFAPREKKSTGKTKTVASSETAGDTVTSK